MHIFCAFLPGRYQPFWLDVCQRDVRPLSSVLLAAATLMLSNPVSADTPLGWIHSNLTSAYTIDAFDLEISAAAIAVNEDIDFLNIRDELLAGTRRLVDNSGDLDGYETEIHFGLHSTLSAFYKRKEQDLTLKLGPINSLTILSIDEKLSTMSQAYGLKWNFFDRGYFDNTQGWHAASLELTRTENQTDDFTTVFNQIFIGSNITITFRDPQSFSVANLEDEGWKARLIYSWPLSDKITSSVWAGYAEVEATSGTSGEVVSLLAGAFEQGYQVEDRQVLLGASLNWQVTPRLPLQLSYEYINIRNIETEVQTHPNNSLLPDFMQLANYTSAEDSGNHTVQGSMSYWITPRLNISLKAKVFSNQFLGVIPHFNNPLSGSFSDQPYGYAGLQIGYRL